MVGKDVCDMGDMGVSGIDTSCGCFGVIVLALLGEGRDEAHFTLDAGLPLAHIGTGGAGAVDTGIGECGSYQGTVGTAEVGCLAVEMIFGTGSYAIDGIAHLDGVEVDFHDALLAPQELDEGCEVDFEAFAGPTAAGPEEPVLGCLLRDGAGTMLAT